MEIEDKTIWEIEDILIEFASLYNSVTTSDLQGIANRKTRMIINILKEAEKR